MSSTYPRQIFCFIITSLFLVSALSVSARTIPSSTDISDNIDPLADQIRVTVTINQIRALGQIGLLPTGNPNFYVKVIINNNTFTSPTWRNIKYVNKPNWSASLNVPSDVEWVDIKIQLYDKHLGRNILCDISPNYAYETKWKNDTDVEVAYSTRTGHWMGDDWAFYWGSFGFHDDDDENGSNVSYFPFIDSSFFDPSGAGRLNGCDDGSIYQYDRDCELWFDITQTDPDGDGIPVWLETNVYNTSPVVDDSHLDPNHDGIPITWDWQWGYDPFAYDNHSKVDLDNDGLTNYQEYLTSQWGSDPFRKDLFIEMDQMRGGPNGEPASIFPNGSKDLLRTAYDRQNIVYHLDDGSWGAGSGSEMIPFDNLTVIDWGMGGGGANELSPIYDNYFLHGNESNWRRGVFHYGVVIYQCSVANGNAFGGDAFQVSFKGLENKSKTPILKLYNPFNVRDVVFASAYMHETGHTLGLMWDGVDNSNTKMPWMLDFWRFRPYKSVMNYGYMFKMVDYSDGSHGKYDFDDWSNLDLTYFNREMPWFHH